MRTLALLILLTIALAGGFYALEKGKALTMFAGAARAAAETATDIADMLENNVATGNAGTDVKFDDPNIINTVAEKNEPLGQRISISEVTVQYRVTYICAPDIFCTQGDFAEIALPSTIGGAPSQELIVEANSEETSPAENKVDQLPINLQSSIPISAE